MSNSVAKRTDTVAAMVGNSQRMRALMGGSRAMRAAGETYLPKFEAESKESYDARISLSWLFNGYRKTVRDMSGRVFEKPVEVKDGPKLLSEWIKNVDMAGRDLSTFSRDVFEDGYDAGVSYIMVDAPPRKGKVTKAQATAANLRPYLVHLKVEDVLGWRTETVNNITTLVQFRIMETVTEPDPEDEFADKTIDQVRVLDVVEGRVQTRVFRKNGEEWAIHEEPTFSNMKEITVIPFYANRSGFFTGEPVLDDLADVNIAHWQSQSDQRTALRFGRVAVFHTAGRDDQEGAIAIAPGIGIQSRDPNAKAEWVEHKGIALGAGRQDLKDLEFQMETHGMQLLVARLGAQSATGEALDAAKETSTLSMTADQLQDTLEQALSWMTQYGGTKQDVTVSVNKEFGAQMMGAQEFTAMLMAVNTGIMTKRFFYEEMKRRGMISPDTDIDAVLDGIDAEGPNLTGEDMDLGT